MHDSEHHVTFGDHVGDIQVTGMRATVNDSVHIQIEVVKLGQ